MGRGKRVADMTPVQYAAHKARKDKQRAARRERDRLGVAPQPIIPKLSYEERRAKEKVKEKAYRDRKRGYNLPILTDEEKAERKAAYKERQKYKRVSELTPEQLLKRRARNNTKYHRLKIPMSELSPEVQEIRRNKTRVSRKKYMSRLTEEQKQKNREKQRRYHLRRTPEQKREHSLQQLQHYYSEPEKFMLSRAKSRAKSRGLDFNLEITDILIPEYCPILGIKLQLNNGTNVDSPSLDRINNKIGYVKGNVCVISGRANSIKGDSSIEELEKLLEYMKSAE